MRLQEADDTDLGPFMAISEEAIAEMDGYLLQLIKRFYDDERMYYAAGPGKRFVVRAFRTSDIEGAVDVIPQPGSSFPWSQVARQQLLIELVKTVPGMFTDPQTGQFDTAALARLLPFAGIESLYEAEDADLQEAMREELFETYGVSLEDVLSEQEGALDLAGEQEADPMAPRALPEDPMLCRWQNHEIHRRQHRRTLVSATYRDWSEEAQAEFKLHYARTVLAVMQAQQQMAMMAAMAQGKVPLPDQEQEGPEGQEQQDEEDGSHGAARHHADLTEGGGRRGAGANSPTIVD